MEYLMLILALVIGYPIFMIFTYMLAKAIFPKIKVEKEEAESRENSKITAEAKARRIRERKARKLVHA